MKRTYSKAPLLLAFAAAIALPSQSKADEVITQTTITEPVVVATQKTITTETMSAGPGILVQDVAGQQLMVPTSMSCKAPLFVTTGATITGFTCWTPDDLLTRRDDLLARIFVEKRNGKLSDDQANALTAEVLNAYSGIASLPPGDEFNVDHVKAVKKIYGRFDKISNDIRKDSHQGNKQLAGRYNVLVL